MGGLSPTLRGALTRALGATIHRAVRIGGGDVNQAFRIVTSNGDVFVKHHASPVPGMFEGEAASLNWLAATRTLRIPRVVACCDEDPAFLALEWIDPGVAGPRFDDEFGRGLAHLHRAGAPTFGWQRRGVLATIPLDNSPDPSWATFLAERRLLPLTRLAIDAGRAPAHLATGVERLCGRLPDLIGPAELPSRLHGDLWSGNVMASGAGAPVLVDPSSFGGHREVDLAMMRLFGGFGERVFDAYRDAFPLAAGHEERVRLNQILPLLVHVILFGAGYLDRLEAAIGRYVDVR